MRTSSAMRAVCVVAISTLFPDFVSAQSLKIAGQVELVVKEPTVQVAPDRYVRLRQKILRGSSEDRGTDKLDLGILDLAGPQVLTLSLPMAPIHERAADLLIDGRPHESYPGTYKHAAYKLELIRYEPEKNRAGLLVRNKLAGPEKSWRQRFSYVHWDLKAKTVARSSILREVSGPYARRHDFKIHNLGPEADGVHHLLWHSEARADPKREGWEAHRVEILRLDVDAGKVEKAYALDLPASNNKNRIGLDIGHTPGFEIIAFAEYSEQGDEPIEPRPAIYVVWLNEKRHITFEAPYTCYGIAIDRAGTQMVIGSNQSRTLTKYDLKTGKKGAVSKTIAHLHHLGLSPDEKWLYVMPAGKRAELRAWPSLKLKNRLTPAKVIPGQKELTKPMQTLDRRYFVMSAFEEPTFEEIPTDRPSKEYLLELK
ncbi:MAG: hypothetical protein JXR96_13870 [Deltaproteobacteria bacterium]|nr:hypothetical protein [Deltaproteobacteria bacterium]